MITEETAEVAGRSYVSKVYRIALSRQPVVDLLRHGVEAGGGRVVSCSFPDHRVAPVFLGAEDGDGRRYGLLTYPFTTTKRPTLNRPPTEGTPLPDSLWRPSPKAQRAEPAESRSGRRRRDAGAGS